MTVYAITDTKKGEQVLRLLIFKLPQLTHQRPVYQSPYYSPYKQIKMRCGTVIAFGV